MYYDSLNGSGSRYCLLIKFVTWIMCACVFESIIFVVMIFRGYLSRQSTVVLEKFGVKNISSKVPPDEN